MQPNQITLNVDPANDDVIVQETYSRYEEYLNRSVYMGTAHVPDQRDLLALYRTFPTRTGNFKGVSKSALKLTKDVEVPGVDSSTTLTAPIIIDCNFSVPVGATPAALLQARQRLIAALDDDTLMNALSIQLMV